MAAGQIIFGDERPIIEGLGTLPNHVATLKDIDDAMSGNKKAAARLVATTNQAGTYNPTTQTLTYGADGELMIDGVPAAVSDRIGLVGNSTAQENGIYVVIDPGSTSTPAEIERAADFNNLADIRSGVQFNVSEGTLHHDTTWQLSTPDPIVIDTTALTFVMSKPKQNAVVYNGQFTGDGVNVDFNVNHDLGKANASVTRLYCETTQMIYLNGYEPVDADNLVIHFATAPPVGRVFSVTIVA